MRRVYMDNNATSPLLPEVFEAMCPFFMDEFGNASSIHQYGQQARAAVERARESVAKMLGCRESEIVFTSGGTEGDNIAIQGMVNPGDHIITSAIEHSAVQRTCRWLRERGCEVTEVPVDGKSLIDPADIRKALRPNTKLISIMMANNETGSVQPVEEIGKMAAEADVFFHTDAVQAAGKVPIDVERIGCDLLTISGHKIHAPKGVGALYVRKGTHVTPLFHGGNHERHRRAGTENVPGIVALGKAAEVAVRSFEDGSTAKLGEYRDRLERTVLETIDEVVVNGAGVPRVPTTTNLRFAHIEGEALVIALDLKGVAVSTGAACSSGAIEPSHVLTAMGLSPAQARASLRFSLGKQNVATDVDYALSILPEAIQRLRDLSPVYNKTKAVAR